MPHAIAAHANPKRAAMSVRKRIWTTPKREQKETWIVDYADLSGTRRQQTFDQKRDADAYHDKVKNEVRHGIHTPISSSITVSSTSTAMRSRRRRATGPTTHQWCRG